METMKTKKKILYVTLDLMSNSGFDGVSVRDIAYRLGIKESSLYKHYKSKQDIFENLLLEMDMHYKLAIDGLNFASDAAANTPLSQRSAKERMEELAALCTGMFYYFLSDKYAGNFRRVLTMEQYKSASAYRMYREHFFNTPLSLYAGVFRTLLSRGEIPYNDPDFLALEFYSPVFMLLCRCDDNPAMAEMAAEVLHRHVIEFGKQYCRA